MGINKLKAFLQHGFLTTVLLIVTSVLLSSGCSREAVERMVIDTPAKEVQKESVSLSKYYEKFYLAATRRAHIREGTTDIEAIDILPKDPDSQVNWTAAVIEGFIDPRGSLDPDAAEEVPLDLNIFIEAKVPIMGNVIFPHSIHTYWLSCNNCHPQIFLPEAGANPISMDEIFKGEWCGRCHDKVAFKFWPRANCIRCHIIPKGMSLQKERF